MKGKGIYNLGERIVAFVLAILLVFGTVVFSNTQMLVFAEEGESKSITLKFTEEWNESENVCIEGSIPEGGIQYNFNASYEGMTEEEFEAEYKKIEYGTSDGEISEEGILSVNHAGSYTITAIAQPKDENGTELSVTTELCVKQKAGTGEDQHLISFANPLISYTFGTSNYIVSMQTAVNDNGREAEITYAMSEVVDGITIDSSTGEVKIEDPEKVCGNLENASDKKISFQVIATMSANDYFEAIEGIENVADVVRYSVDINFEAIPENPYSIEPEENESGWYHTAIVVHSPEGYGIAKSISDTFGDTVSFDEDEAYEFYLQKSGTSGITSKILLSDIQIDTAAPEAGDIVISYSEPAYSEQVSETQTIKYYSNNVEVSLEAKDTKSGIREFQWEYVRSGNVSKSNEESLSDRVDASYVADTDTYTATFYLPTEEGKSLDGILSVKAIDFAGNCSEVKQDGQRIIVDNDTPIGSVSYTLADSDKKIVSNEDKIFYSGAVNVQFSIQEINFDPKDVIISIKKDDGEFKQVPINSLTWSESENSTDQYETTYPLAEDGEYVISMKYSDASGHKMDDYQSKIIVIDQTKPVINLSYKTIAQEITNGQKTEEIYFQGAITATVEITEKYFLAEKVTIQVKKDGSKVADGAWNRMKWTSDGDVHTGTFLIPGEEADGEYSISVDCMDFVGNEAETYNSPELIIDTVDPEIEFSYEDYKSSNSPQTATIIVREHNFNPKGMQMEVQATDIKKNSIVTTEWLADLQTYIQDMQNWKSEGDVHTLILSTTQDHRILVDANYQLTILYEDLAKRTAEKETDEFIIDMEAPTELQISYSDPVSEVEKNEINEKNFYYYGKTVEVTFSATDITSGVKEFTWSYVKREGANDINVPSLQERYTNRTVIAKQNEQDHSWYSATVSLPLEVAEQLDGYITVKATDNYGNSSDAMVDSGNNIIYDSISPTMTVSYTPAINDVGSMHYYNKNIDFQFEVEEINFYPEDVSVTVSKDNGEPVRVEPKWKEGDKTDQYIGTYTIPAKKDGSNDGQYVLAVKYKDRSGNINKNDLGVEIYPYTTETLVIDTILPDISFEYKPYNDSNDPQTAIVTIDEVNFCPSDIYVEIAEAKDINGVDVNGVAEIKKGIETYLRDEDHWEKLDNGNGYAAKLSGVLADAYYKLAINYTDLAQNKATTVKTNQFMVDHTAPSNDIEITYSDPVYSVFLSAITFGYYNKYAKVRVHFETKDTTSGVDYFTWGYTKETHASNINVSSYNDYEKQTVSAVCKEPELFGTEKDLSVFEAEIEIPKKEEDQLRGNISVFATDKYGNCEDSMYVDEDDVIVVDTTNPKIVVQYPQAVSEKNKKLYYNKDIQLQFTITEANFYSKDVKVEVTKDGSVINTKTSWADESADVHVGTLVLKAPDNHAGDGEYVVRVSYTDRSGNAMETYKSKTFVIDTTEPVCRVSYENTNVINEMVDEQGITRKYYGDTQVARVEIEEHNFDEERVNFQITAKDVAGNALDANALHMKSMWSTSGDSHVMTITYPGDANYSFDIECSDLASNETADFPITYFTVDKSRPEQLAVTYSQNVLDEILSNITFGFYNGAVTATLTAVDNISMVNDFVYSYVNAEGVSGRNAQAENQRIEKEQITYSESNRRATATFTIPREALGEQNQFNGNVRFTADDRCGNRSDILDDNTRIVVDNISPTASVEYNSPVHEENGIAYYDGNITATITVQEDNFYEEDVEILVTRDGANYEVNPTWEEISVEEHNGTFTLSDDGDYLIKINYSDRSDNAMTEYESTQMTIDTEITPAVIKINGADGDGKAYKDEVVPSISFEDKNFDHVDVQLLRTVCGTKNVDVTDQFIKGKISENANGGNGSFDSFDKLAENDGIYMLSTVVYDKAGHQAENEIAFTVNRFGSIFEYSDYLADLIKDGGRYVQMIDEDLIITEYNADRLVPDSLQIEISCDGRPLDNCVYDVTPSIDSDTQVGDSGWYQYQYTISKQNFTSDGVYKIAVSSVDETGNTPENTSYADKAILFRVDNTAPEINSITGLEKSIVNATSMNVTYSVYDTIGLKSVSVYLGGNVIDTITDFTEDMNNYFGEFIINESNSKQDVQIVVEDLAGNITDTSSQQFTSAYAFNSAVTVSTNAFVRFIANKKLLFGTIGGVCGVTAVGAGGTILIRRRKRLPKVK